MVQDRRTVLAALKDKLSEISEVETVMRAYFGEAFDITQYTQASLPLIAIAEPEEETYRESTGQRSLMMLNTRLWIYLLDWAIDPDATKYEDLVKKIRDKIGNNFDLGGVAAESRVMSVSTVEGTMPLYHFFMDLEMRYDLDETAT